MFTGSLAFGWPHDILHMVGSRAHHDQRIAPAPPRLHSQPADHRCPAHGRYDPRTRIRAMVSPTTTTPNASLLHLPTRFARNAGTSRRLACEAVTWRAVGSIPCWS